MATLLGDLLITIRGDSKSIDKAIDGAEKKSKDASQKIQKNFNEIGKTLSNVGRKLTMFVTLPLMAIGAVAVKNAADFEKQKVAFETMLGSAKKAGKLLDQIEKFAATTPFQMPGLIEGAKRLLAFGTEAEDVIETMRRLGNAAMGDQNKLDSLTLAFGKLQAKGKATMLELNMFIQAGVPILDALAEQLDVTTQELFKMIETGQVGFDDVNTALTNLTTGTGKLAGLIEKQAETLAGLFSTLKDNLGLFAKDLGDILLPMLKNIVGKLIEWVQWFRSLSDQTKKTILILGGIVAAIGPIILIAGKVILAIKAISAAFIVARTAVLAFTASLSINPIFLAIGALTALAAVFIPLILKTKESNKEFEEQSRVLKILKRSFEEYKESFQKSLADLGEPAEVMRKYLKNTDEQIAKIKKSIDELKYGVEATGQEMIDMSKVKLRVYSEDSATRDKEIARQNQEDLDALEERLKQMEAARFVLAERYNRRQQADRGQNENADAETLAKRLELEEKYTEKLFEQTHNRLEIIQKEKEEKLEEAKALGAETASIETYYNNLATEEFDRIQDEEFETLVEGIKKRRDAEQKATTDRINELVAEDEAKKGIEREYADLLFDLTHTRVQQLERERDKKIAMAEEAGAETYAIEAYYAGLIADERIAQAERAAEERKAIEAAFFQFLADAANLIGQIFNTLAQTRMAARMAELEAHYGELSSEEEAYQDYLAEKDQDRYDALSDEEKREEDLKVAAQKAEQNRMAAMEKEKKKLIREEAKRQKAAAIFGAIISTALAIIRMLADPGGIVGAVMAVLAGITGALQIAAIAAQPLPSLAKGGVLEEDQDIKAHKKELITPLDDNFFRRFADSLLEALGERINGLTRPREGMLAEPAAAAARGVGGAALSGKLFLMLDDGTQLSAHIEREIENRNIKIRERDLVLE